MIIIKKKVFLFLIITIGFLFSFTFIVVKSYADNVEKRFSIFIDPGHGGYDGGCQSSDKKYIEKNITLDASLILTEYLRSSGYVVKLTRIDDNALAQYKKDDIHRRVNMINDSKANVYVSLHVNSYPSKLVSGSQVFYRNGCEESKKFAGIIMTKLNDINKKNRSALSIKGKYLVDNVEKTGCLIELGFITNDSDLKNLINEIYLRDLCLSIYLGIVEYLEYIK